MKTVTISHTYRGARIFAAGSVLRTVLTLPLMWAKRIRNRRELKGLLGQPDYLLKDVGIRRYDITREAMKPFWIP